MINLIYLIDHILYLIYKIIFSTLLKKHKPIADNQKIKNRIVFKIKTGSKFIELLSPETMKLLGSSKKDVDQDKDVEDVLNWDFLKLF